MYSCYAFGILYNGNKHEVKSMEVKVKSKKDLEQFMTNLFSLMVNDLLKQKSKDEQYISYNEMSGMFVEISHIFFEVCEEFPDEINHIRDNTLASIDPEKYTAARTRKVFFHGAISVTGIITIILALYTLTSESRSIFTSIWYTIFGRGVADILTPLMIAGIAAVIVYISGIKALEKSKRQMHINAEKIFNKEMKKYSQNLWDKYGDKIKAGTMSYGLRNG